jgi:HEAT repeat protein
VWGDVGYQRDPAQMFGIDYNGSGLLGWHGAFLDAQRAWRRTFHVPLMDTAWPGGLPIPEYLKRVPDPKSAETSRLYGYVRVGEYQNLDQLGKDACHPWHNRGHTSVSRVNNEPFMDDHTISPPGKNDLFFRWHTVVEEVRRSLGPDQAIVTATFPAEGQTVGELSAVMIAFDRKVSANAPASNVVQLVPGKVTVNGKPAMAVSDAGGDDIRSVVYMVTGFPAPADGVVKVELAGTAGYKGHTWTFQVKKGAKANAGDSTPESVLREAGKALRAALTEQRSKDIARLEDLLKAPDADDIWLGHLFRTYSLSAEEGVPLLVRLLDHPSDHVKGHAVQLLQYRYGPQAKAAVSKLIQLLNDKGPREWWLREWTARALGVIAPQDAAVAAALVYSVANKGPTEPVNRGSIEVIGRLDASVWLDLIRKYVSSPDPATQTVAYRAVGQIVNAAKPSLDDLKKLTVVNWKGADGGYSVFRAIQEVGPKASFTIPALVETYRKDSPICVKAMVIETLGKLKAGDAAAVQLLIDTVPARWGNPGDPPAEKYLSDLARDALQEITPSDVQAVTVLAKALAHVDNDVRWQAAIALQKYGPKAAPAVPALTEALRHSTVKLSTHQIGAYLDALRAIGPDARSAGDTIVELLSERSPLYKGQETFLAHYLQAYLLVTLGEIGVPDGAKPYILDLLNNSDIGTTHGYAGAE